MSHRKLDRDPQQDLFGAPARALDSPVRAHGVSFVDPDPEEIFIGNVRLRDFLGQMGLTWVIEARALLRTLDWAAFEKEYAGGGRVPYAPAAVVGLILYGFLDGKSSLREIEGLARRDIGAMWMSGGIFPDHSVLGRFLQRHAETLTVDFFQEMTGLILAKLGSSCTVLAGDGTVIESAASRFQTVRLSMLEAEMSDEDDPDEDPPSPQAQKREAAVKQGRKRAKKQRQSRKSQRQTRVNLTDPESVYLRTKRGGYSVGYVTSYLVNADRFIVAHTVDPSDELSVVSQMVDQAKRVSPTPVERLLLDANYSRTRIFAAAIEHGVDLLCPEPPSKNQQYAKSQFTYDPAQDVVICPASETLTRRTNRTDTRSGLPTTRYAMKSPETCRQCLAFGECTTSKQGRTIRRGPFEWAREAVRIAMTNPLARERYNQRMAMVEPVISELRGRQNLNRLARVSLASVRLETTLHAAAYNLRRYARRAAAAVLALLWAFMRVLSAELEPRPQHI